MVYLLALSLIINLFLLCIFFKEKNEKPKQVTVIREKRIPQDPNIERQVRELYLAYRNLSEIEEFKKENDLTVEREGEEWAVYESMCYYGGCLFDKVVFPTEYEAYKHAAVLSLLKKLRRNMDKDSQSVKIADINYSCGKFRECSGIDY